MIYRRQILISTAAFRWFPILWRPEGTADVAEKLGYDGLHLVPIRTWSYKRIPRFSAYKTYEDPRVSRPDDLPDVLMRWKERTLLSRMHPPLFLGKTRLMNHRPTLPSMGGIAVEISVDVSTKPDDYIHFLDIDYQLSFNTRLHYSSKNWDLSSLVNVPKLIDMLPDNSISFMHLEFESLADFKDFNRKRGSTYHTASRLMNSGKVSPLAPYIIDFVPFASPANFTELTDVQTSMRYSDWW